jgi:hypothetical protein
MTKKLPTNRLKDIITIAFIVILISACSDGSGHIVIEMTEGHLESMPSGLWLSSFDLDYSPNAKRLKLQVEDKLKAEATLIDKYVYQDGANKVGARLWEYRGQRIKEEYYAGGIWKGPKVFPPQEYHNGGPAENLWITIEFERGIPYSKLLPDHYMNMNPQRKYEHSATIESTKDQGRRLFLFGYGALCKKISLF